MTDQTQAPQENAQKDPREYWHGFPEAPFSDSFKWVDTNGFEHLSTVRGWTFNAMSTSIEKATTLIAERGGIPAGSYRPQAQVQSNHEPTRQPIDDNGHDLPEVKTFTAEKLSVSMNDGKYYYKVIGKPFTQYGVPVWNEVLDAAKLDVSVPGNLPNISGWRVDYIEQIKDGKKRMKVTRLLPSAAPF